MANNIPFDLNSIPNLITAFIVVTVVVIFRYFFINSLWVLFKNKKNKSNDNFFKKVFLYPKDPLDQQIQFEIKWSIVTTVLFGFIGVLLGWLWQNGYTQIYMQLDLYGYSYLILSWFLMSVIQDFYFYVTHLMLHQPLFYKRFHQIHHESLHPTVWASFSFHPVEGLIQAIILPLICLFLPLHPVVLIAHLTLMTLTAAVNHGGFELYPKWFKNNFFTKYLIGATHHADHHRYYKYNYGLFYTWWDLLFKTEKIKADQSPV